MACPCAGVKRRDGRLCPEVVAIPVGVHDTGDRMRGWQQEMAHLVCHRVRETRATSTSCARATSDTRSRYTNAVPPVSRESRTRVAHHAGRAAGPDDQVDTNGHAGPRWRVGPQDFDAHVA